MPNIAAPTLRGQLEADFMHSPLKQAGASLLFRVAGNLAESLMQDSLTKTLVSSAIFASSVFTSAMATENMKDACREPVSSFDNQTDKDLHMASTVLNFGLTRLNAVATGKVIDPGIKPFYIVGMALYDFSVVLGIGGPPAIRQEAPAAPQAAQRA